MDYIKYILGHDGHIFCPCTCDVIATMSVDYDKIWSLLLLLCHGGHVFLAFYSCVKRYIPLTWYSCLFSYLPCWLNTQDFSWFLLLCQKNVFCYITLGKIDNQQFCCLLQLYPLWTHLGRHFFKSIRKKVGKWKYRINKLKRE